LTAGDLSGLKEDIMKLTRVILVCTLLLSAALPTFAAPPCQICLDEAGPCSNDPNGSRCRTVFGVCTEGPGLCLSLANKTVLADWQVASVEITRRDPATKGLTTVVVTPTAIAQSVTPQLPAQR
jgi:hypothetical protein